MSKINYLNMSDVHKVKRFTVISDKVDMFTPSKVFWVLFWILIFFPMLIIVLPWYAFSTKLCDIKAELHTGETVIYEHVKPKVISSLHKSCEF